MAYVKTISGSGGGTIYADNMLDTSIWQTCTTTQLTFKAPQCPDAIFITESSGTAFRYGRCYLVDKNGTCVKMDYNGDTPSQSPTYSYNSSTGLVTLSTATAFGGSTGNVYIPIYNMGASNLAIKNVISPNQYINASATFSDILGNPKVVCGFSRSSSGYLAPFLIYKNSDGVSVTIRPLNSSGYSSYGQDGNYSFSSGTLTLGASGSTSTSNYYAVLAYAY